LASTNLVVELGIVISIFLGWQFVVGEYAGGVLLILGSWLLVSIIKPKKLIEHSRKQLGRAHNHHMEEQSFWQKLTSAASWQKVGHQYVMEWNMVWKDVTVGFTIAGIIAAFVPNSFFESLFIGSGVNTESYTFWELLEHVLVGPVAAFFTFIGSMGNIPLAALLFTKGVSFAGVIAFMFSDLVVFPVLRINATYYGWKMSLFMLFLLFTSLVGTSLLLHYGLDVFHALPLAAHAQIMKSEHFKIDYTFFMNITFLIISGILVYFGFFKSHSGHHHHHHDMAPKSAILENTLKWLAFGSYVWLTGGLVIKYFVI